LTGTKYRKMKNRIIPAKTITKRATPSINLSVRYWGY
jgi:hypothetical protein